ncbi:tyrosine-type recombinase/integrase [Cyclobacterium sp. 1_MG-2023]|uniref:tyrosine-type recombinase/integrase n=1 Tax=Cyclobacterium sp. 1_MG-2023 TaxID=3062681 RepID=UPI0026E43A1C|nr:tyrosine-type recombinase/integrase [Cyclobacterium sp. 1_MG-2023]MDO6440503.1 tyrosine-type recombinase/integrase [Cyclobacterium sp. 1_MG-2023]
MMSKIHKNYGWLNSRPNSAKTLIDKAKREVPGFALHIQKFEEQITIKAYAESTVFSYSRSIAQISLYFKKSPLDLEPDEINSYLFTLRQDKDLSDTFFKHAVYGLRFFYRIYDLEDRAIRLPNLKNNRKLPVVFSQQELRRLFKAPQRLKQRVLLSLIYSAGLRVSEVCKLKITDIDFDRNQIHIRESKNNKSRYVVLSAYISQGLLQYINGAKPKTFLFNGREKGTPLGHSAVQQTFRLAMQKAGILKEACVHTLRHSFATHLLEQGIDIVTIKEQLGHAHIQTTMMYLHVAKLERSLAHSPFDRLYPPAS